MSGVSALEEFQWTQQPAAERWVLEASTELLGKLDWAKTFADRLYKESGNRFIDLIDTIILGNDDARLEAAKGAGWTSTNDDGSFIFFENPNGIFPMIAVEKNAKSKRLKIELKVDFVADFLAANLLTRAIVGEPWSPYRSATIVEQGSHALSAAERHGWRGFVTNGPKVTDVFKVHESFRMRTRSFNNDLEGFEEALKLIDDGIARIGRDYTCDLFFAAEREYWQRRIRAAQFQYARQSRLGIGWANHDHHTYRASREQFKLLVHVWEKLGFICRERFYAGIEAGWGAQVMEQPITRITTFNDVDLTPEELMGDFSHDGLPRKDSLGTVGLWCALHGEAFLQAGMHHLECQFDFDALRDQIQDQGGIKVMKPFTNFPYLRQAFTEGEKWMVDPTRIDAALKRGYITSEQAEQFRAHPVIGSHLENLERNAGFKGFNQQGVSEIIAATDPRKNVAVVASH